MQSTDRLKPVLPWARLDAEELADRLAALHLEPGGFEQSGDRRVAEKGGRAAAHPLQSHLADRHAPRPEARPGAQELSRREVANEPKAFGRLHDIVPKPYGDRNIVLLFGLPVEDVGEDEVAAVRHVVLRNNFAGDLEHLGSDIHAGDMLRALLRQGRYEAA